jgi:hypothetical protein
VLPHARQKWLSPRTDGSSRPIPIDDGQRSTDRGRMLHKLTPPLTRLSQRGRLVTVPSPSGLWPGRRGHE